MCSTHQSKLPCLPQNALLIGASMGPFVTPLDEDKMRGCRWVSVRDPKQFLWLVPLVS
jgi:hypothetical protein